MPWITGEIIIFERQKHLYIITHYCASSIHTKLETLHASKLFYVTKICRQFGTEEVNLSLAFK